MSGATVDCAMASPKLAHSCGSARLLLVEATAGATPRHYLRGSRAAAIKCLACAFGRNLAQTAAPTHGASCMTPCKPCNTTLRSKSEHWLRSL